VVGYEEGLEPALRPAKAAPDGGAVSAYHFRMFCNDLPLDPDYRTWARGAQLAELHALAANWPEFEKLLCEDPSVAPAILSWVIPDDDPDVEAYRSAISSARNWCLKLK
jgi:hypothetical protein